MIDEILQEVYNDQQKQCSVVNLAFKKRIEETDKAKTKLEDHHARVSFSFDVLFLDFISKGLKGVS